MVVRKFRFRVDSGQWKQIVSNSRNLRKALDVLVRNADCSDRDGAVVIVLSPSEWQQVMQCMTDILVKE